MENNRLFELADELKALRERKDALEAELKQVNMDIDNVDWHLSNLMGETETQNFTRAGTMFFLSTKTRASAKAGQKDELFGALRANGYGDLITETINAGSLSSFVKEQIAENEDVCETDLAAIKDYLQNAAVVAFDFETAPLLQYRDDPRAALDAHRACIVGISLSVAEGSAIYIPLEHFDGGNADSDQVISFLRDALWTNPAVTKVAHNLAFESMFLYALGIIIQPPCYDTIAAAQMTLKNSFEFRGLSDSGLKKLVPELLGDELPTFEDVTGGKFFDELNSHDPETVRYACADSDYALRLYRRFNEWFDAFLPRHRWIVENVESPTAVYCGLMKYNGLLMDEPAMIRKQGECAARLLDLREKIRGMIGDVDIGANAGTQAFKDYLFKELGLPVLKTTAKNAEAADDQTLTMLAEWCAEHRPELVPLFELVQYTQTFLGRRRYLPGIRSQDWGRKSFAERCALNTPIQGTAADILKLALARLIVGLPERPWLKPLLQIHDELVFELPEEKLPEAVAFIQACMDAQPFPEMDVPIVAEAAYGPDFGHMKEME